MDINAFAKFHEIPSLPFQDIEKPKRRGWTNGWTLQTVTLPSIRGPGRTNGRIDGQRENSIPPTNTVCWGYTE